MNRRHLLAASAALAAMSAPASAEGAHQHGSEPNRLAAAAAACLQTGTACLDHCLDNFGDASLAACARATDQMLAIVGALLDISTDTSSALLAPLAKVAATACQTCEQECRKHADTHAACKACAETCAATAAECRRITG